MARGYRSQDRCGPAHHNWKRGKYRGTNGYIYLRVGRVYVLEHRHVMEEVLGRKLLTSEHVHHVNGVPTDNRPENLHLTGNAAHGQLHGKLRSGQVLCGALCQG